MIALNLLVSSFALASSVVAVPTTPPKACKNPVKRYEWRQMPLPQRKAYIDAVLCLNKKPAISGIPGTVDRFSDFQAVHKNQTLQIHWVGHFLLWHRYFLATYEKALRDECGYTGGQPYWDWSLDANPNNLSSTAIFETDVFSPTTGFGGNGNKIEPLPSENPSNLTGGTGGGCVQTGPFVAEAFTVNYPTPSCLKRDFVPWIINKFGDAKNVQKVLDQPDYTSMAWEVEGKASFDWPNIHASGHFGVGGVLGQAGNAANSPGEPIFYLHHGNVDYVYWLWQQRDLKKRLRQVGGPVARKDYGGENVTLEFEVGLGVLAPVVKLRDLMDTEGGTLCYTY